MSLTAAQVMDASAVLLNDSAKTAFTYAVQIPYLNIALGELRETLETNNVPMSNKVSAVITIPVGTKTIGGGGGDPALPTDLIELQSIWEQLSGQQNEYIMMTRVEFLPLYFEPITDLVYFSWIGQIIKFVGATTPRDVKLNYIADVLPVVTTSSDAISLFNAKSFLTYRTAALASQFSGENKERSDDLNTMAQLSMDRFLTINTKGRQAIVTRRRPFMMGYKMRGGGY